MEEPSTWKVGAWREDTRGEASTALKLIAP